MNDEKKESRGSIRSILLGLTSFIGLPLCLFLTAGRWDWIEAWVYIGLALSGTLISRVVMARRNPDLVRERARSLSAGNVAPWDRWLMPYVAVFGPLLVFIVAGLNERFLWLPAVPLGLKGAGILVVLAGMVVSGQAMLANRFFSGTVRIQKERGHQVITDGPYRWVRHPGYLGGILGYLGMPMILGSYWAFIPAGVGIAVTILRTAFEDRLLARELDGYGEYSRRTRYRLFPGIW
jgi:protein-S-isoprenylcysteine O-methyltransferase Ste14